MYQVIAKGGVVLLELLHKVLFGFISGLSEVLFVSTSAHQLLYRTITGCVWNDSLLYLGIHLGCLVALLLNCKQQLKYFRNEKRLERPMRRRKARQPDIAALSDIRILNTAVVPILLGFLFYSKACALVSDPFRVSLVLLVNGVVLFLPRMLRSGNKNGRSFTRLDALLIGFGGALGVIPGFTRTGCVFSVGAARGAERSYVLELGILLSIPAMLAMLFYDFYACAVATGVVTALELLGAFLAAIAAFAGTQSAIIAMRYTCKRSASVGYAYYSWGLATFLLLIYLFVS